MMLKIGTMFQYILWNPFMCDLEGLEESVSVTKMFHLFIAPEHILQTYPVHQSHLNCCDYMVKGIIFSEIMAPQLQTDVVNVTWPFLIEEVNVVVQL